MSKDIKEHLELRNLEPKDLTQFNDILRYAFQVTDEQLLKVGWKSAFQLYRAGTRKPKNSGQQAVRHSQTLYIIFLPFFFLKQRKLHKKLV